MGRRRRVTTRASHTPHPEARKKAVMDFSYFFAKFFGICVDGGVVRRTPSAWPPHKGGGAAAVIEPDRRW